MGHRGKNVRINGGKNAPFPSLLSHPPANFDEICKDDIR